VGKRQNWLEEIGDLAGRLLARFRIASHRDAAFGALLDLGGWCRAPDPLITGPRREDAVIEINLPATVSCGRRPRQEMRRSGGVGVESTALIDAPLARSR